MPELPEVETVRRGLAQHVLGYTVTDVNVLRDSAVRHQVGGVPAFQAQIVGNQIVEVARRGKFLWLNLFDGSGIMRSLVIHLGMSGQIRVHQDTQLAMGRHVRVRFMLTDSHNENERLVMDFVDQRTFGYVLAAPLVGTSDGHAGGQGTSAALIPQRAAHIARDVLDPAYDEADVIATIRKKRSEIKRVLLDQRVVSGIGNIYADEALWAAKTHPQHNANELSRRRISSLLSAVRDVMQRALAQGGTSFDALYVNVNGQSGYFSQSLAVYGRAGLACHRCATPIRKVAFANRSSHFCARCQRLR